MNRDATETAEDVTGSIWPRHYADTAIFAGERARIFERTWLFAGFTDQLADPNDFLTLDVAGTAVMIHNFDGEPRAFHNVCSHRASPIHCAARGTRLPRCPYHGWTYNRDGVPVGIPGNAEHFGLDRAGREALALRRFVLAACGRFLFVRLADEGPDLDGFLGGYGPVLRHLSDQFTDLFDDQVMDWNANWKHGVENVLEVYHADSVHPESFRQFTDRGWDCSTEGEHSRGQAPLSEASGRWWAGVAGKLKLQRSDRHQGYDHFHIFPNLAIGVTEGAMMSVQTYEPDGPDRCRLHFRLCMADSTAPSPRPEAARRAVEEQIRSFNTKVLGEDRAICERVHEGAKQAVHPPLLGRNESRLAAFHRAYLARLTSGS